MSETILEVDNVHKKFNAGKSNEVYVLRGINLTMNKGEFYALMGPSGSGKSTLLNIAGGLIDCNDGKIKIKGSDLYSLNDDDLTEVRSLEIGWIFQSFGLISNLTALENVMIPMDLAGVNESVAEQRATELLDKVGLTDRIDHFPDGLSGGQQQRVAIARALANNPVLILADEPTGNLDTQTGLEIIELFRELVDEGISILMVTHDVQLAHASQKVFILKKGIVSEEEEV